MSQVDKNTIRSPWDDFEVSENAAVDGVKVPFGDYWFKIAYSGKEHNPAFSAYLDVLLQPVRAAFPDLKTSDEQYLNVVKKAFCEKLVTAWGSKAYSDDFMVGADKEKLKHTPANVYTLLSDPKLTKLFDQLMLVSSNYSRYLASNNKADAGN